MATSQRGVRFTPDSRHCANALARPLSAKNGDLLAQLECRINARNQDGDFYEHRMNAQLYGVHGTAAAAATLTPWRQPKEEHL
jgi:hypothetical protein